MFILKFSIILPIEIFIVTALLAVAPFGEISLTVVFETAFAELVLPLLAVVIGWQ